MYLFFGKSCNRFLQLSENRMLSFLSCFTLLMPASAATAHKLETQLSFPATTSDSFHLVREIHYGQGAFFFRTISIHIHLFIEVVHDTAATANGWQMLSQWTILWSALWGDGSQSKQCQEAKPQRTFKLMKANVWTEVIFIWACIRMQTMSTSSAIWLFSNAWTRLTGRWPQKESKCKTAALMVHADRLIKLTAG